MKVFISSVVSGFESFRDAAAAGIEALGYTVIRSEDFGAVAASSQQTCLEGIRVADVVVLLLGARYGFLQPSGLSATHEEYREAKQEGRPVLVFAQTGVTPEPDQKRFIKQVLDWASGKAAGQFATEANLQKGVTQALHRLSMAQASGPLDEDEMFTRAMALLPERPDTHKDVLALAIAAGPRRQVLSPTELEAPGLVKTLKREALLGEAPVLDDTKGTERRFEGNAIVLEQEDGGSVLVDELGSVRVEQPAHQPRDWRNVADFSSMVILEEDVRERLEAALHFAGCVLDTVDPLARAPYVAVAAALYLSAGVAWRTEAEHRASPNRIEIGLRGLQERRIIVRLSSARRDRAALKHQVAQLSADLTALLRREIREK